MQLVHAIWSDGSLRLWGESGERSLRHWQGSPPAAGAEHPFALAPDELEAVLAVLAGGPIADDVRRVEPIRMLLPTVQGRPLPSERLAGFVELPAGVVPSLEPVTVPVLALRNEHALRLLASLSVQVGHDHAAAHDLRYWMRAARFVLDLLADHRFVPTLIREPQRGLAAAWEPWMHDDAARRRLGALVAGMPPIVRALAGEGDQRPWPILSEALSAWTDATVRRILIADRFEEAIEDRDPLDPHVAWLHGLLGAGTNVPAPDGVGAEMLRDVGLWIGALDEGAEDRPVRAGFRLREPEEGAPDRWCLEFLVVPREGLAHAVTAAELFEDPGLAASIGAGGTEPEERFIHELGRAARIYPKLEPALAAARPTQLTISTEDAYAFLAEFSRLLEESGFAVELPAWWGTGASRLGVRLRLAPADDGTAGGGELAGGLPRLGLDAIVDYEWVVSLGELALTRDEFRELARLAAGGASIARLRGRWIEIRPEEIRAADALMAGEPTGRMALREAIQVAHGIGERGPGLSVHGLDAVGWIGDLLEATVEPARMPKVEQPKLFRGELRPYQLTGLAWLRYLDRLGLGACLADDMGLGKTIQLIALLQSERAETGAPPPGPTLLVAPTSVLANWHRELARFAPELKVIVHHGAERATGDLFIAHAEATDVVLTSYSLVTRDRDALLRPAWHRVVLDEAQNIKNPPTKQTATIRALRTPRRIALTGTPVENRLAELWSIMEFLNPGYLGRAADFRRRFAGPIERQRDPEAAERLRRLVRPFILRRLKTDPRVIDDLPPCVTTKEYAGFTPEQAVLYERTVKDMLAEVSGAEGIRRRGLVLATLVRLKQICNHPALPAAESPESEGGWASGDAVASLSTRSGKCRRLVQMLDEVLAAGDKAIVFTQFRRMGHLLTVMLQHELDSEVLFLHGGTPTARRQQLIDRFQDPHGDAPIFILSLKAGGVGLNLTAANHVFHFDRWWNPAVENQATDRAFRIGQTRSVHVHKFVCTGTLEERIDQMLEEKQELAENIVGAGEDWLTEMSTGQLRDLLALRRAALEGDDGEPPADVRLEIEAELAVGDEVVP